jgi:hypothetical protein
LQISEESDFESYIDMSTYAGDDFYQYAVSSLPSASRLNSPPQFKRVTQKDYEISRFTRAHFINGAGSCFYTGGLVCVHVGDATYRPLPRSRRIFLNLHKNPSSPTWGIYALIQGTVSTGCGFLPLVARTVSTGCCFHPLNARAVFPGRGFHPLNARMVFPGWVSRPLNAGTVSPGCGFLPLYAGEVSPGRGFHALNAGTFFPPLGRPLFQFFTFSLRTFMFFVFRNTQSDDIIYYKYIIIYL